MKKAFFMGLGTGFKKFSHGIAQIVNTLLLLIVYVIGVGITSIIAKLVGKKFLEKYPNMKRRSYWADLKLSTKEEESYYRQF